jgi:putative SOS response-associated peptidase YedK
MCGRFTLTITDIAALAATWGAEVDAALLAGWRPRYNVAPGQRVPLLAAMPDGPPHAPGKAARRIALATFGLPAPRGGLLLNARSETAARKPTFREAMARSRAAVPVDGFFEWEGPPSARRPSWFHRAGGAPFLLAALAVPGPDGATAFAILTSEAVEPVRRLHDRMPVILAADQVDGWLADGPPPPLPAPVPGWLTARPVSPRVNSPRADDAACLEPAPPPAPPAQRTLF